MHGHKLLHEAYFGPFVSCLSLFHFVAEIFIRISNLFTDGRMDTGDSRLQHLLRDEFVVES